MAQNYNNELYSQATVADTTLTRMENNFAAQKSSFSGVSYPADQVAGMLHMRTGGTGDGMRVRNSGDTAWHKVLTGTASLKLWMYRNDSDEGWTIDAAAPTDRVLSLKGGSDDYNVNGGNTAGTWTITGITGSSSSDSHVHQVYNNTGSGNVSHDQVYNSSGVATDLTQNPKQIARHISVVDSNGNGPQDFYTASDSHSHTITISTGSAWRPAAAVGTLQYPDLS